MGRADTEELQVIKKIQSHRKTLDFFNIPRYWALTFV